MRLRAPFAKCLVRTCFKTHAFGPVTKSFLRYLTCFGCPRVLRDRMPITTTTTTTAPKQSGCTSQEIALSADHMPNTVPLCAPFAKHGVRMVRNTRFESVIKLQEISGAIWPGSACARTVSLYFCPRERPKKSFALTQKPSSQLITYQRQRLCAFSACPERDWKRAFSCPATFNCQPANLPLPYSLLRCLRAAKRSNRR